MKKVNNNIVDIVRSVTNKWDDYDETYKRIKFNSLMIYLYQWKRVKIPNTKTVVTPAFHEWNKYSPQDFLDKCYYKLYMLEYDRIDGSEGIDVNKINNLRESIICHY